MITGTRVSFRALSRSTRSRIVSFSSTTTAHVTHHPSFTLDPSMKSLLEDVDISLLSKKSKKSDEPISMSARELETLENDQGEVEYHDIHEEPEDYPHDEYAHHREDRKSPAARFGSDGIGTVVLSAELQRSVTKLIDRSNKTLLHSDAKRLFVEDHGSGDKWSTTYDVEYKTRRQRYEHGERDGTAFASVILPPHYSAIYAVLHHVKHRLGESWNVDSVIDWGAGTGSGLWAALNVFQKTTSESADEPLLANSTIDTYFGVDNREGLVTIGKQLLRDMKLGRLTTTWKKSFDEAYRVDPAHGHSTIALSAFMLSALPSPIAQKNMVREMWDSGAQTIILIDHNTPDGFQNIAEARQYLLELGRSESENLEMKDQLLRGSHVLAPCPHDRPCPLQRSGPSSLVCGFSQRLQRPTFVRRTKHAKEGHEDIGYSYVVIRRGPRPDSRILDAPNPVGRIGAVGKEAMEREKVRVSLRELQRAAEHMPVEPESPSAATAARFASAHAHLLTPTDVKPISADQDAPPHVPMDDGVAISGEAHVQVASVHAVAPFDSPRADEILPDETLMRAQVQQVASSPPSTSTPLVSDITKVASEPSPLTSRGDPTSAPIPPESEVEESPSKVEEALRREAYEWPRLVFPPLKRSGHIIIDACTREGKIMRLTIPRSQGKQAFYDARKSSWGDIFPHSSKNKPIERFQPPEDEESTPNTKGSDIGKRSKGRDKKARPEQISYAALDDKLRKEQLARKKAAKREYKQERDDIAMGLTDFEQ